MGVIYALLALALNMIYSTTRIINFAHGELVMVAAMTGLSLIVDTNLPYGVGILGAGIVTICVSVFIYYTCVKPFGNALKYTVGWIMTTLGAGIIITNVAILIWGSAPRGFPAIGGDELITFLGVKILPHELWTIVIVIALAVLLHLLMSKTILGSAIKAAQFDHDTSRLMGINAERIVIFCFILSGLIATVGGVLLAPISFVYPTMTSTLALKGFGACTIGGMGNNKGAFIGGLTLGLIEAIALGVFEISPGYRDVITFLVIIVVMTIKPAGITGVIHARKV